MSAAFNRIRFPYRSAMLRVVVCASSAAAKKYFAGGLSQGDYYVNESELAGVWGGVGAKLLGLEGEVTKRDFHRLCDNRRPSDNEPLTLRTKANRRVGYDLNFHCPKSVSILHSVLGNEQLLAAFQRAVTETMQLLELEMKARVRAGGVELDRVTGNLVWAQFVHTTARPVGGIPDPHLHAHCFTFNATWDEVEKAWKAGQFGDLKRDAAYFEACFHSRLAQYVQELGYSVVKRGRFWEVAGVSDHCIEVFSRRTTEIEGVATSLGIIDAKEKDKLGAKTRSAKTTSLPESEVRADWRQRLGRVELAALKLAASLGLTADKRLTAQEAINFALSYSLERASVVHEKAVLETALRHGVGSVSLEELRNELATRDLLRKDIDGRAVLSTKEILEEERSMLDFARNGRGACRPFLREHAPVPGLSRQQQAAFDYVLGSTDRLMIVRGRAGTGKTTLMKEVVAGIARSGKSVFAFAPSAQASRGVLRESGFKDADTVAKLLGDVELQKRAYGQVIWIDEAGLMGTKTLKAVFELAELAQARVILTGDTRQHRSVERGDGLRLLERFAGLGAVTLSEIRRQQGEYRSAMEALADGRLKDCFGKLEQLGAIREVKPNEGHQAIADEYVQARRARKSVLVVSPTHAEGREVTDCVRATLRGLKKLGRERTFERLEQAQLTDAERSDGRTYSAGQVVQFHRSAKGFKIGERYTVVGRDPFGNVLARSGVFVEALPLAHPDRFSVYNRSEVGIAKGDTIRITRNGHSLNESFGPEKLLSPAAQAKLFNAPVAKLLGIKRTDRRYRIENGSLHEVAGFTLTGDIKLKGGQVVAKDFCHFTHGYCVTSHNAQGKTVDRVLVAQSAKSFGQATTKEQFYVSTSRAKESVVVFTDDKASLMAQVTKSGDRMSSTELHELTHRHERRQTRDGPGFGRER